MMLQKKKPVVMQLNDLSVYRTELMDSVLYVLKDRWNPKGYIENTIYLNDGIHLNSDGYQRFDSCIVSLVRKDMETIWSYTS